MRILLLGGTLFVGRAIVEEALVRGHDLTLFSRGQTGAGLFPDVARRVGDRDSGDYTSLADGSWDAVVDVSAYVPRHVAQAMDAVAGRTARYLFISTGSVYDRTKATDGKTTEESARLAPIRDTEEITNTTYGPLKVACEDDVRTRFGDRATIVRPGVVAGPHDPTDRFTWWVRRGARGGRIALPGRADQPVQVVDSRDLARLVVRLVEAHAAGTYDAVGPAYPTTLRGLIEACAQAVAATAEVVEVPADSVPAGFPLVLPDPTWDPMFRRSPRLAHQAGMPATPLTETAAAVLTWDRDRGLPPLAVELDPERETQLLAT